MREQTILLIFLVMALGATLWLYILKAKKQVTYKGDERWSLIQLKANNTANAANWLLILLLVAVPVFVDEQITFTIGRVTIFGLIYFGFRNLVELAATIYFDERL